MKYDITATEKNGNIYYSVQWSPLTKADRYDIITKVPALAGVFEIYWMDESKRLRLFMVGQTNYGGLRSELRRITDPELCKDNEKARKIMEEKEIWYRYTLTDSSNIMADVVWFFMQTYFPEKTDIKHSGRFNDIFLKESAPDKLMWVP
ncbi:MAG: hypothetical protein FWD13_10590 [Treponema sp.]|nr:hypothetical protein [Treponema sp.]